MSHEPYLNSGGESDRDKASDDRGCAGECDRVLWPWPASGAGDLDLCRDPLSGTERDESAVL